MLSDKGFDLWADGYDESVGVSDDEGTYPFAGYKNILGEIYRDALSRGAKTVLDIGFGTGLLSARLYENGCEIYGQDFSEEMLRIAQEKMPLAKLYRADFAKRIAGELLENKYDAIIATYSLHHLTDERKIELIKLLTGLLTESGRIYIGDVAFETREEMDKLASESAGEWDTDEIYFVFDEMKKAFPRMKFKPFSHCAGLLTLDK
ncbi:MAG: class I SAM-dependent methyltransferase [Eubacteriales bacterium]|nr:class I SAM-dependent methyltransferase [Eubacteriales bacterium]MDD3881310.1 class I SAM-dependent methyltransferase [Eubacteriales bacterium]MDD4512228.1 class I SAM-dependent methyltransferase [Eubacteriales bacterium]